MYGPDNLLVNALFLESLYLLIVLSLLDGMYPAWIEVVVVSSGISKNSSYIRARARAGV